jgi:hypothetical protein
MRPVCSFCGRHSVVAWFEGPDFRRAVGSADEVKADEAWLACSTCLDLVEADDRSGLAERGAVRLAKRSGVRPDRQVVEQTRLHFDELFWSHRSL